MFCKVHSLSKFVNYYDEFKRKKILVVSVKLFPKERSESHCLGSSAANYTKAYWIFPVSLFSCSKFTKK